MTQDTNDRVNASRKVKRLRVRTLVALITVGCLAAVLAGGAFLLPAKATGGGSIGYPKLRSIRLIKVPFGQTVTLYYTHGIKLRARCIETWNPIGKDGEDNLDFILQHVGYIYFENVSATDAGTTSAGPDNDHGPIGEDHQDKHHFEIGQEQNVSTGHALGNDDDFGGASGEGGGENAAFVQHGDGASFHVFQAMVAINLYNSDCAFSAIFAVQPKDGYHHYGDGCSNDDDDHQMWQYEN